MVNRATAVYDVMINVEVDIVPDPNNVPPGFDDSYDFSRTYDCAEISDVPECTDITTASGASDDDVITHADVREAYILSAMPADSFVIPPISLHETFGNSTALSVLVLHYANDFPVPINYLPNDVVEFGSHFSMSDQ